MRSMHIAVFGIPHPAHMNAVLPIMGALVRRGYRVTCVTSDAFVPRVQALGVEPVCCRRWLDEASERESMFDDHPKLTVLNMNGCCRVGLRIVAETESLYERDRPAAVIYDLVNFAGRILAHRWGIPGIQISPHIAFDEENLDAQIRNEDFRKWVLAQGAKANKFFEHEGMTSGANFIFHREKLNIYTIPKLLQPEGTSLDDVRCFYAGRCPAEQPYYGDWRKTHTDGRPIVLVVTSTTYVRDPGYFRACIDALSGLHWHVVLSIGSIDPMSLGPLPPHFEVVKDNAHVKILPYAGLFILQGGNMSVAEAAFHGVPMIATTFGFAEIEWCAENSIARLGVGIHLRKEEITVDGIRAAAVRIEGDSNIQSKVRNVSKAVQREAGSEDVVNRIDEYLGA